MFLSAIFQERTIKMLVKNELIARADEINKAAAKSEPLENSKDLAESLFYLSLRRLYFLYKHEQITKAEAVKQKQKLLDQFIDASYNLEMYRVQAQRHKAFARYSQDIKNNGCDVCRKLDKVICGFEE